MNKNRAVKMMLGIVIAVTLFHLSIVIKLIPYDITWGGRLKTDNEMYVFETVSILLNLLLGLALLVKGGYVRKVFSQRIASYILWFFFALFALNTIGNAFAETSFEKSFTVLTLLSCILLWTIFRSKNSEEKV